jgi:hypothetical protein
VCTSEYARKLPEKADSSRALHDTEIECPIVNARCRADHETAAIAARIGHCRKHYLTLKLASLPGQVHRARAISQKRPQRGNDV